MLLSSHAVRPTLGDEAGEKLESQDVHQRQLPHGLYLVDAQQSSIMSHVLQLGPKKFNLSSAMPSLSLLRVVGAWSIRVWRAQSWCAGAFLAMCAHTILGSILTRLHRDVPQHSWRIQGCISCPARSNSPQRSRKMVQALTPARRSFSQGRDAAHHP